LMKGGGNNGRQLITQNGRIAFNILGVSVTCRR
jgi:hypothetical protein